jgi:peptide/nickel transport system permease protein
VIAAVLRRLGWCVAMVWFVVTLSFVILHAVPGDPARALVGPNASEETLAHARALHGLDESMPAQYLRYLGNLAGGDLGQSNRGHRPVREVLLERAWPTLQLLLASLLLQLVLGTALGAAAARYRDRWPDRVVSAMAVAAMAAPPFVVATVLLYVVGFQLSWLPINGYGEGLGDRLAHLVLPAISMSLYTISTTALLLRGELVTALGADFVRTGRAKGVSERGLLWRHALRPSFAPIVSIAAVDLGVLVTGAVIVESIFGWPGLGREALLAVLELDIPLVLGTVIVTSVTIAAVTLVADLLVMGIDPRTRSEG